MCRSGALGWERASSARHDQQCRPRRGRIGTRALRNSLASVRACTPNAFATTASEAPARYCWVACLISASVSRRRTGFESRPVSSCGPARRRVPAGASAAWPARGGRWPSLRPWSTMVSMAAGGFESRPIRSTRRCENYNACRVRWHFECPVIGPASAALPEGRLSTGKSTAIPTRRNTRVYRCGRMGWFRTVLRDTRSDRAAGDKRRTMT